MLNEPLFLSSFDKLKNLLIHELTIFHLAVLYVLMYVIYKALGRYVYFKPQEHASKFNRTFLTISLLIIMLRALSGLTIYLPFLPEHRWFYTLCGLVIFIAPLSILVDRLIWKYDRYGQKNLRNWCYSYLPISKDYYKVNISKSEKNDVYTTHWEEEGVESTKENIHSDVLLNILAIIFFLFVGGKWAYDSTISYGYLSYVFYLTICFTIAGIFLDRAIFSWVGYLEKHTRKVYKN